MCVWFSILLLLECICGCGCSHSIRLSRRWDDIPKYTIHLSFIYKDTHTHTINIHRALWWITERRWESRLVQQSKPKRNQTDAFFLRCYCCYHILYVSLTHAEHHISTIHCVCLFVFIVAKEWELEWGIKEKMKKKTEKKPLDSRWFCLPLFFVDAFCMMFLFLFLSLHVDFFVSHIPLTLYVFLNC